MSRRPGCSGFAHQTAPAVNLSLQWAPNDTSEYMFEAFYNGYRNTQHNSLFFTFVDWWYGNNPQVFNFLNNYFSRSFAVGIRHQLK
jgi:iron complex outermembrane recepter protein